MTNSGRVVLTVALAVFRAFTAAVTNVAIKRFERFCAPRVKKTKSL